MAIVTFPSRSISAWALALLHKDMFFKDTKENLRHFLVSNILIMARRASHKDAPNESRLRVF
jgi:hypothetical protein